MQEPLLDLDDIQGNIYPGFNKDHQTFKFLGVSEDIPIARRALAALIKEVAKSSSVREFAQLRKAVKAAHGGGPSGLSATWMNLAFSFGGLVKLTSPGLAGSFAEPVFRVGLAARSVILGDPDDPNQPGHSSTWQIGKPGAEPIDIVFTIAADRRQDADAFSDKIDRKLAMFQAQDGKLALRAVLNDLKGDTLGGDLNGHEHFGFKDGVSQPGIRGRIKGSPDTFVTERIIAPSSPLAQQFGRPGQVLVWPGQLLLGQPRQNGMDALTPLDPLPLPRDWVQNGSYMVLRLLEQDVAGFWNSMRSYAQQVEQKADDRSVDWLAARVVGRWRSGAPLMRTPGQDNPDFVRDNRVINDFRFRTDGVKPPLIPGQPALPDLPLAMGGPGGTVWPFAARIRKVNPRDDSVELGSPADPLSRLLVRRGIPYGTPLANPMQASLSEGDQPRGLIFVSYQASIEQQFEFLMRNWVNADGAPRANSGRDAVLGRHVGANTSMRITDPDGVERTVPQMADFIIPRGGGYFFAPSLKGLDAIVSGG